MHSQIDGNIVAIDYGAKRVGIAMTHSRARLPKPFSVLTNDDTLLSSIQDVVERESAVLIVVGLPRSMDGTYSEQTRIAEAFGTELEKVVNIPVVMVDETLTSVDAETVLQTGRSGAGIDAVAASLILERYLQEHREEFTL